MITYEEQIDSQFITELFRKKSFIEKSNCITHIQKNIQGSEGALTYCYHLTYQEKRKELPKTVYIKFDKIRATTHYKNLTRNEINFYKFIGNRCKGYIVGLYEGDYTNEFSYLILEDYSNTHATVAYETDFIFYNTAVKRLAQLQKQWYDIQLCDEEILQYCPINYNKVDIQQIRVSYMEFVTFMGDYLNSDVIKIMDKALCVLELNIQDINSFLFSSKKTLIHGDFHLKNCLFSLENQVKDMRILDWQWWGWGIGVYDIAHLLNLYLPIELKEYEEELLMTYFTSISDGMNDLTWNECLSQYRLFTLLNLFKPTQYAIDCKLRRKKVFWKDFLDRIIISYEILTKKST